MAFSATRGTTWGKCNICLRAAQGCHKTKQQQIKQRLGECFQPPLRRSYCHSADGVRLSQVFSLLQLPRVLSAGSPSDSSTGAGAPAHLLAPLLGELIEVGIGQIREDGTPLACGIHYLMWSLCLHTRITGNLVTEGGYGHKEKEDIVIMVWFRVVQVDTWLHPAAPDYPEKKNKLIRWHLPLNPMSTSCAWSIAWNVCYHIKKYVDQTVINQKEYLNNTPCTNAYRLLSFGYLHFLIIFSSFVLNRFWNNHKASLTLEKQQAQAYSLYFGPQMKLMHVHCL